MSAKFFAHPPAIPLDQSLWDSKVVDRWDHSSSRDPTLSLIGMRLIMVMAILVDPHRKHVHQ